MARPFSLLCAYGVCLFANLANAEQNGAIGKISAELNRAQTTSDACTLTFVITNGLGQPIDKVVYETVLFDKDGRVDRLTLFDFGMLPSARPRVRQFAMPQIACDQVGRVLFNGVHTCKVEGVDQQVCEINLMPSSRIDIEVLG